jgi:hypothetical protein
MLWMQPAFSSFAKQNSFPFSRERIYHHESSSVEISLLDYKGLGGLISALGGPFLSETMKNRQTTTSQSCSNMQTYFRVTSNRTQRWEVTIVILLVPTSKTQVVLIVLFSKIQGFNIGFFCWRRSMGKHWDSSIRNQITLQQMLLCKLGNSFYGKRQPKFDHTVLLLENQ